ncbi:FAD-dependent oxidoreductase [Paraburkholderia phytofirmans]|uniref:FAD-dependent oxidoreductase n=1 Tax=Paraburkholderia phytofirmans TaxID=261302 RepID=UPI0038BC4BE9
MYTLRTIDDALAINEKILPGVRVVIVGAGFIGSEVASSAAASGAQVVLLKIAETAMSRAVCARLGHALGQLHKEFGVSLVCNARVTGFGGESRVQSVWLADGRELPADIVVVGIGVLPNKEWLADCGLRLTMGFCVTGRPMQDQKRYTLPAMAWRGRTNGGAASCGQSNGSSRRTTECTLRRTCWPAVRRPDHSRPYLASGATNTTAAFGLPGNAFHLFTIARISALARFRMAHLPFVIHSRRRRSHSRRCVGFTGRVRQACLHMRSA